MGNTKIILNSYFEIISLYKENKRVLNINNKYYSHKLFNVFEVYKKCPELSNYYNS